MDNQRIDFTPEVISQQRAICDAATPGPWAVSVANEYPYDDIGSGLTGEHVAICGSKNENTQFIITARTVLPAALDALEASMAREVEKDATIARLTAERDAAIIDLRGSGTCFSCKHFRRNGGNCFGAGRCRTEGVEVWPCDEPGEYLISIPDDGRDFYDWRGPVAANTDAPTGAESEGHR